MFRLAHISDVHLGPLPPVQPWQLMNKRITGYLNWKLNRSAVMNDGILDGLIEHIHGNNPSHIAVTGDLVNLALPAEILRMRHWLENLGVPEDVSIILGNHDTYVPRAKSASLKAWKGYALGDDEKKPDFPYLRTRDNVALIGVNSGGATLPFLATGRFGRRQAKELGHILAAAKNAGLFRIVMIHHPPFQNATSWAKRLIGDQLFRDVILEQGAELVLHGHTHIKSFKTIDGPAQEVPVVGVPSASQGLSPAVADEHGRPAARYNLFDIRGEAGRWSCEYREFGYSHVEEGVSLISTQELYPKP